MEGSSIITALNGKLVGAKRLHLRWAKSSKVKLKLLSTGVSRPAVVSAATNDPSAGIRSAPPMKTEEVHTIAPKEAAKNVTTAHTREDGGSCEIKSDTPEIGVAIELQPNEDMMELMNHTLFLRTVKPETVSNVTMIVEGLRVHEATNRAL